MIVLPLAAYTDLDQRTEPVVVPAGTRTIVVEQIVEETDASSSADTHAVAVLTRAVGEEEWALLSEFEGCGGVGRFGQPARSVVRLGLPSTWATMERELMLHVVTQGTRTFGVVVSCDPEPLST